ncbi:MAG: VWA domain-containing protein [Deltaproteobacteria bacterium]|nr:MAG: VWA domain-containing protein [Deltaproteobacteria bacterium]
MHSWLTSLGLIALAGLTAILTPRLEPPSLPGVELRPLPFDEIPVVKDGRRPVRTPGHPLTLPDERSRTAVVEEPSHEASPSPTSLAIALDTSGSMRVRHRLDHATHATRHLLAQLEPHERVTLLLFAEGPRTLCASCTPTEADEALSRVTPLYGAGASDLGTLLAHLQRMGPDRSLVLTDGTQTWSSGEQARFFGSATPKIALIAPGADSRNTYLFDRLSAAGLPVLSPEHPRDLAPIFVDAYNRLTPERSHASR